MSELELNGYACLPEPKIFVKQLSILDTKLIYDYLTGKMCLVAMGLFELRLEYDQELAVEYNAMLHELELDIDYDAIAIKEENDLCIDSKNNRKKMFFWILIMFLVIFMILKVFS